MVLPYLGWTQTTNVKEELRFYLELGIRDAQHELSLVHLNLEDEKDFWMDQKAFENKLRIKNPSGFQQYINGKAMVFRKYQSHLRRKQENNNQLVQQISYYIIHSQRVNDINSMEAVAENVD